VFFFAIVRRPLSETEASPRRNQRLIPMELEGPSLALFLYGRLTDRLKVVGGPRQRISLSHLYPPAVRADLVRQVVFRPPGLTADSAPDVWAQAHRGYNGRVLGIMLCKPFWAPTAMSSLDRTQVFLRDFWQHYGVRLLAFVEIVRVIALAEPVPVQQHRARLQRPTSTFFEVSEVSRARVYDAVCHGGQTVRTVLGAWGDAFPLLRADLHRVRLCCALHIPHAVLCSTGTWSSICFPYCAGRHAAGVGLHLVRALCDHMPRPADADAEEDVVVETLSPDVLQRLLSVLRVVARELPARAPDLRVHVEWIDRLRSSMLRSSSIVGRKAYEMAHLINCVVLSGFGRDAHHLRDVCLTALKASVQDQIVRGFYEELVSQSRAIPSATTVYRHRLTLHLGFCHWIGALTKAWLEDPDGICRWGTVDSSQQGNHDLVYSGSSTMLNKNLISRFRDALLLIQLGLHGGDAHRQALTEATARLATDLIIFPAVPTGVGSGCASFKHKLHAIAHSLRLTSPSWSGVSSLLSATCTWTGDLGTESRLCLFKGSLLDLFGQWPRQADEDDEGEGDGIGAVLPFAFEADEGVLEEGEVADFAFEPVEDEPERIAPMMPQQAHPYDIDGTGSIYIPGMLHIVSNITKDLKAALVGFDDHVSRLSAVCRLLSRKWTRRRFLASCMRSAEAAPFVYLFTGFSEHVHEDRWGTVLSATSALLAVRTPLQRFWSRAAYQGHGGVREEMGDVAGGGGHAVRLEVVDYAIGSGTFWGYCRMIQIVGEVLEHLSNFAEACPCHRDHHPLDLRGARRAARRRLLAQELGQPCCPMATKMAPEFAAGEPFRMLRDLANMSQQVLMQDPQVLMLSPADRGMVMQDFGRARRHILFNLELKLSFWGTPPWSLMALGHPDENVARRAMREALQFFQGAPADADHHFVTRVLCTPGTEAHAQAVSFATGAATRFECPIVARFGARFRFASVSERWVEGRHAQSKAHLRSARSATMVHTAFTGLRVPKKSPGTVARVHSLEASPL